MRAVRAIIALYLVLGATAAQQQSGCPPTNTKKYEDITTAKNNPDSACFTAASTPPLAQAAYAFDVPRVKCLLAAKADVNQRVQNSLTGQWGAEQWALGAAINHMAGYQKDGVTQEMVDTVQLLLDAGANPNIVYFRNGNTPLYQVAFMVGTCWSYCGSTKDCCPTPPNLVKIVKSLVAAGAKVNVQGWTESALESGILGKANVATSYCRDPAFAEVVDFLLAKGATVNVAVEGTGNEAQDCPKLFAALAKAKSG